MNEYLKIDKEAFDRMCDKFSSYMVEKIIMQALMEGGKVLKKSVLQSLLQAVPNAKGTKNDQWNHKPMTKGIRVINDQDYNRVVVSGLKDVRNLWFALGVPFNGKDRKLIRGGAKDYARGWHKRGYYRKEGSYNTYKTGANRGKIKGTDFFTKGIEHGQKDANGKIEQQLDKLIKDNLK